MLLECLEVQFSSSCYNNLLCINEYGSIDLTNLRLNWNDFQGKKWFVAFVLTRKQTSRQTSKQRRKIIVNIFLLLWGNLENKRMHNCNLIKGFKVTWYQNFK